MPSGGRPYTKQQKQEKALDKAERKIKDSMSKIYDGSFSGAYVEPFKLRKAKKEREHAKQEAEKGPKGVKSSQITTKDFPKDLEGREWRSIKSNKNKTYTTQVTPGEWKTKGK